MQIVNGVNFMANPDNYLDLTCSCIRFFLGGFMTDFKIDPTVAASANGLYEFLNYIEIFESRIEIEYGSK